MPSLFRRQNRSGNAGKGANKISADIEQRIDEAKKRLEQQRNRLQQLEARKTAQDRKQRTRKLILIGVVVMTKAEKDELFRADLLTWLDEGIPEKRNRVLFDLAEEPEGTQSDDRQPLHRGENAAHVGQ